jgi:hypothetical protein
MAPVNPMFEWIYHYILLTKGKKSIILLLTKSGHVKNVNTQIISNGPSITLISYTDKPQKFLKA